MIPLPPFAEQQRIVERLEDILPEIEKLQKDETKLEALQKSFPKKMKDSILQSAIQGRLTEQLKSDGDARDLVRSIEKEKGRLVKEGKIKKEKPLRETMEGEIPFDIPENWCWVRVSEVSYLIPTKKHQILEKEIMPKGKFPVISQSKKYIEGFSDSSDKILKNPGELVVFGDHSKTLKYITFDFIVGADGTKILCQ